MKVLFATFAFFSAVFFATATGAVAAEIELPFLTQAVRSSCTYSTDCPGNSFCKAGRCVTHGGYGTECTYSTDCPGNSFCSRGSCSTASGNGAECTENYECPGSEACRNGRCSR